MFACIVDLMVLHVGVPWRFGILLVVWEVLNWHSVEAIILGKSLFLEWRRGMMVYFIS